MKRTVAKANKRKRVRDLEAKFQTLETTEVQNESLRDFETRNRWESGECERMLEKIAKHDFSKIDTKPLKDELRNFIPVVCLHDIICSYVGFGPFLVVLTCVRLTEPWNPEYGKYMSIEDSHRDQESVLGFMKAHQTTVFLRRITDGVRCFEFKRTNGDEPIGGKEFQVCQVCIPFQNWQSCSTCFDSKRVKRIFSDETDTNPIECWNTRGEWFVLNPPLMDDLVYEKFTRNNEEYHVFVEVRTLCRLSIGTPRREADTHPRLAP